jgi:hypothetical protein
MPHIKEIKVTGRTFDDYEKPRNNFKRIMSNIINYLDIISGPVVLTFCILAICAILFIAVFPNPIKRNFNNKQLYLNEKFVIVGTNEGRLIGTEKFQKPIVTKIWLIQRMKDTSQFAELSSYKEFDNDYDFYITNEMWYKKGINDTLFFKYIKKDRFFTINK